MGEECRVSQPKLFVCSCLDSQSIDRDALEQATGLPCSTVFNALCGGDISSAEKAIAEGNAIIACQQERGLFEEIADELEVAPPLFVDLRDRAGWTEDTRPTSPKMAALIADELLEKAPTKTIDVESSGTCLIVGETEAALKAAEALKSFLSVTVLLTPGADVSYLISRDFDLVYGEIVSASGALGGFEVEINNFQARIAGGRGAPQFEPARDGARSNCDIILDISDSPPMFSAHEKREGYLRAEPGNGEAISSLVMEASHMVGTFEQPLYVKLDQQLCAHSRAKRTGCTRCLDLCPTGAILPAGDHVSVDPMSCAGCGLCSAVCPSGAISYDAPPVEAVFKRIETLASTWRGLSTEAPRLLVHDGKFGRELIQMNARFGRGLTSDVIPMEVHALAAFGHAEILTALATGFSEVFLLLSPTTDRSGLELQLALVDAIAGEGKATALDLSDPDQLSEALYRDAAASVTNPILPLGSRRQVTRLAAKALNEPESVLALPEGSPYGAVEVDTSACTLCLSCVSLCPSGALVENPDKPELRFQEEACLQCGVCKSACPESAITLDPRLNLSDEAIGQSTLHEEEPFACIECGKLFGVRSTIMKITEKLAGKNPMFSNPQALKMIQMCDTCRVGAVYHSENNPMAAGERPRVRTSDDYH